MQEVWTRDLNLLAIGKGVLFKAMKLMKSLSKWERRQEPRTEFGNNPASWTSTTSPKQEPTFEVVLFSLPIPKISTQRTRRKTTTCYVAIHRKLLNHINFWRFGLHEFILLRPLVKHLGSSGFVLCLATALPDQLSMCNLSLSWTSPSTSTMTEESMFVLTTSSWNFSLLSELPARPPPVVPRGILSITCFSPPPYFPPAFSLQLSVLVANPNTHPVIQLTL